MRNNGTHSETQLPSSRTRVMRVVWGHDMMEYMRIAAAYISGSIPAYLIDVQVGDPPNSSASRTCRADVKAIARGLDAHPPPGCIARRSNYRCSGFACDGYCSPHSGL